MKLNNITSLDPAELARGVRGLEGASTLDREIWQSSQRDPVTIGAEMEALWKARVERRLPQAPDGQAGVTVEHSAPAGETEAVALTRIRLAQGYFRRIVLENFGQKCAVTGMAHTALINASHIVGWAEDEAHRVDPGNGIALNRLHDAAFDQRLITFDEDLRLVVGRSLRDRVGRGNFAENFLAFEGRPLGPPAKHELNLKLLARHREAFAQVNA